MWDQRRSLEPGDGLREDTVVWIEHVAVLGDVCHGDRIETAFAGHPESGLALTVRARGFRDLRAVGQGPGDVHDRLPGRTVRSG